MKTTIQNKINNAIALLQRYEKIALQLDNDGYFLAFSGGKDSQLLYLLAELANVKFKAYYSNTTNDPPENVRFLRNHYPNVTFINPKENYYKLIAKKGLPTRLTRYCCAILKEQAGAGKVVLTGERRAESTKRKNYPSVEIQSRNEKRQKIITNEEVKHECIKGKDRLRVRPLLEFTEEEVWQILSIYAVPINPCYENQKRVGCIVCPFAPKKQIEEYLKKYPKMKATILKNLQIYLDKTDNKEFELAEDCLKWWLSKDNIKNYKEKKKQLNLF